MTLLQTLKITCPLTKWKLVYALVYFTENTVMVSSFHYTHYLVSVLYFHTFKFKDPKFQLRSSLKVSADCYIGNFNFEPMVTSDARIHTLLRVHIMIIFK